VFQLSTVAFGTSAFSLLNARVLRHFTLFSCILAVLNSPTIFLRKGFSFFQQALISPDDPETVWETYFADIYQIVGNQWGEMRTKNKARRYPLYKGWFQDKDEVRRFLNSIKKLTTIEADDKNNPSFPQKDNQSTRLVNQGKTIVLRKVCIGLKNSDTDKIDILQGYAPPKK
jgi:hypothetical protein